MKKKTNNVTYVGQIKNTILIFIVNDNIVFIDHHVAHEKILFEDHKKFFKSAYSLKKYFNPTKKTCIKTNKHVYVIIQKNIKIFQSIGLILKLNFPYICLTSHLIYYENINFSFIIKLFVKEYNHLIDPDTIRNNFLKSYMQLKACRKALMSGDFLSSRQALKILYILKKNISLLNSKCPHGRPITYTIKLKDLMKKFGRYKISKK